MPHTLTTTVYTFDELSDQAKQRAREWFRDGITDDYADFVIEDAARMAGLLGITIATHPVDLRNGTTRRDPSIYWSGFSQQGDGACFTGTYAYRKGSAKLIAAEAPPDAAITNNPNNELNRIARALTALQKEHGYALTASVTHAGSYYHAYCTDIHVLEGDEDADADTEAKVCALLRDFMQWIYVQLEAEHDYQTADAQVDESIRANEYDFHEDGRRAVC